MTAAARFQEEGEEEEDRNSSHGRNLTHERGRNTFALSKPCYERLKHEMWHSDEAGPTRSICSWSAWHLKSVQEKCSFDVQLQRRRQKSGAVLMQMRLCVCILCTAVLKDFWRQLLIRLQQLLLCAGVQHLYVWYALIVHFNSWPKGLWDRFENIRGTLKLPTEISRVRGWCWFSLEKKRLGICLLK